MILNTQVLGINRKKIYKALVDEGVQGLTDKYVLLHLYPMYQKKIAFGSNKFPWSISRKNINYKKGICPVAEKLQNETFLGLQIQLYDLTNSDIKKIISAFHKVWGKLDKL